MGMRDLPWRKFPRSAINDIKLSYIASQMACGQECYPLLFFTVMYCMADDDGVFDIGDGRMFAYAMHIDSAEDVLFTADFFIKAGIISKVFDQDDKGQNTGMCIINDWDTPDRTSAYRPAMTAEQRRESIRRKLLDDHACAEEIGRPRKAQPRKRIEDTYEPVPLATHPVYKRNRKSDSKTETAEKTSDNKTDTAGIAAAAFDAMESDKNGNTVATHDRVATKNEKVSLHGEIRDRQTDDSRQTTADEIKDDTHTHESACAHLTGGQAAVCAPPETERQRDPAEPEESADEPRGETDKETESGRTVQKTVEIPAYDSMREEPGSGEKQIPEETQNEADGRKTDGDALLVLNRFFEKRNPAGYADEAGEKKVLNEIAGRVTGLAGSENDPGTVAAVFVSSLEKLSKQKGYLSGFPLVPSMMMKPAIWPRIVSRSQEILVSRGKDAQIWEEELEKWKQEASEDDPAALEEARKSLIRNIPAHRLIECHAEPQTDDNKPSSETGQVADRE